MVTFAFLFVSKLQLHPRAKCNLWVRKPVGNLLIFLPSSDHYITHAPRVCQAVAKEGPLVGYRNDPTLATGGGAFLCVFLFSVLVHEWKSLGKRIHIHTHICQFPKSMHRKKFENTIMYLYTLYLKIIPTCFAIVTSSIPRDRQSLISGCGGAWPPPFALLCLLGCASACAVLPFFARRERACWIGRFVESVHW